MNKLGSIVENMCKFSSIENVCGSCGNDYSVLVTMEFGSDCKQRGNIESSALWNCWWIKKGNLDEM